MTVFCVILFLFLFFDSFQLNRQNIFFIFDSCWTHMLDMLKSAYSPWWLWVQIMMCRKHMTSSSSSSPYTPSGSMVHEWGEVGVWGCAVTVPVRHGKEGAKPSACPSSRRPRGRPRTRWRDYVSQLGVPLDELVEVRRARESGRSK